MGPFPKPEGKKNQVGLEAEVGISIKGEKDQSGRDLLAGHFSGLKRTFTDSAGMLSLFLFCVLWKRSKIDPVSTLFFKRHSDQI